MHSPQRLFLAVIILFMAACQPVVSSPTPEPPTPTPTQTATVTPRPSLTPTRPTSTPTSVIQVTPQSLRGVTIRLWHPWTGDLEIRMINLAAEFNRTNIWGIKMEVTGFGSAGVLADQIKKSLTTSNPPDVAAAPIEMLLDWQNYSHPLVDLSTYVVDTQWGLSPQEIADYFPAAWQQDQVGDQRVGIPALRSAQALYYNQSWAAELGFKSTPSTPEEFRTQACAAAQANRKDTDLENDGTGGWLVDTNALTMLSWLFAFGAGGVPTSDEQAYSFNNDSSQKAFSFLRQMYDDNCAWVGRNPQPNEYFATRQALFFSGSIEDIPLQSRIQSSQGSSDRWTVIPFPGKDKKSVVITSGPSYAILRSDSTRQLAAWLALRFLSQPRSQQQLVEASSGLPVTTSAAKLTADYQKKYPQWTEALGWSAIAQPSPALASWLIAGSILEDAGWQLFQPFTKAEQIPEILAQIDATIKEMKSRK